VSDGQVELGEVLMMETQLAEYGVAQSDQLISPSMHHAGSSKSGSVSQNPLSNLFFMGHNLAGPATQKVHVPLKA
jgi:hypothetical protein